MQSKKDLAEAGKRKLEEFRKAKAQGKTSTPAKASKPVTGVSAPDAQPAAPVPSAVAHANGNGVAAEHAVHASEASYLNASQSGNWEHATGSQPQPQPYKAAPAAPAAAVHPGGLGDVPAVPWPQQQASTSSSIAPQQAAPFASSTRSSPSTSAAPAFVELREGPIPFGGLGSTAASPWTAPAPARPVPESSFYSPTDSSAVPSAAAGAAGGQDAHGLEVKPVKDLAALFSGAVSAQDDPFASLSSSGGAPPHSVVAEAPTAVVQQPASTIPVPYAEPHALTSTTTSWATAAAPDAAALAIAVAASAYNTTEAASTWPDAAASSHAYTGAATAAGSSYNYYADSYGGGASSSYQYHSAYADAKGTTGQSTAQPWAATNGQPGYSTEATSATSVYAAPDHGSSGSVGVFGATGTANSAAPSAAHDSAVSGYGTSSTYPWSSAPVAGGAASAGGAPVIGTTAAASSNYSYPWSTTTAAASADSASEVSAQHAAGANAGGNTYSYSWGAAAAAPTAGGAAAVATHDTTPAAYSGASSYSYPWGTAAVAPAADATPATAAYGSMAATTTTTSVHSYSSAWGSTSAAPASDSAPAAGAQDAAAASYNHPWSSSHPAASAAGAPAPTATTSYGSAASSYPWSAYPGNAGAPGSSTADAAAVVDATAAVPARPVEPPVISWEYAGQQGQQSLPYSVVQPTYEAVYQATRETVERPHPDGSFSGWAASAAAPNNSTGGEPSSMQPGSQHGLHDGPAAQHAHEEGDPRAEASTADDSAAAAPDTSSLASAGHAVADAPTSEYSALAENYLPQAAPAAEPPAHVSPADTVITLPLLPQPQDVLPVPQPEAQADAGHGPNDAAPAPVGEGWVQQHPVPPEAAITSLAEPSSAPSPAPAPAPSRFSWLFGTPKATPQQQKPAPTHLAAEPVPLSLDTVVPMEHPAQQQFSAEGSAADVGSAYMLEPGAPSAAEPAWASSSSRTSGGGVAATALEAQSSGSLHPASGGGLANAGPEGKRDGSFSRASGGGLPLDGLDAKSGGSLNRISGGGVAVNDTSRSSSFSRSSAGGLLTAGAVAKSEGSLSQLPATSNGVPAAWSAATGQASGPALPTDSRAASTSYLYGLDAAQAADGLGATANTHSYAATPDIGGGTAGAGLQSSGSMQHQVSLHDWSSGAAPLPAYHGLPAASAAPAADLGLTATAPPERMNGDVASTGTGSLFGVAHGTASSSFARMQSGALFGSNSALSSLDQPAVAGSLATRFGLPSPTDAVPSSTHAAAPAPALPPTSIGSNGSSQFAASASFRSSYSQAAAPHSRLSESGKSYAASVAPAGAAKADATPSAVGLLYGGSSQFATTANYLTSYSYTGAAASGSEANQSTSYLESYLDNLLTSMASDKNKDGKDKGKQEAADAGSVSGKAASSKRASHAGDADSIASLDDEDEGEAGGVGPSSKLSSAQDLATANGHVRQVSHDSAEAQVAAGAGHPGGLPPLAPSGSAAASRAQFTALQQHIDDLTEEKLNLARGMAQQARINESLQVENEALMAQYNVRGALVEELRKKVERYEAELEAQVLTLEGFASERDNARSSVAEASSRAQALAAEVVNLESQLLQLKSSSLKAERRAEEARTALSKLEKQVASQAAELAEQHKQVEALQGEKRSLVIKVKNLEARLTEAEERATDAEARIVHAEERAASSAATATAVATAAAAARSGAPQQHPQYVAAVSTPKPPTAEAAVQCTLEEPARGISRPHSVAAGLSRAGSLPVSTYAAEDALPAQPASAEQEPEDTVPTIQMSPPEQARSSSGDGAAGALVLAGDTDPTSMVIADRAMSSMDTRALMRNRMPESADEIARQLARWLPAGPVSCGDPIAAVVEEQVRLMTSIHSMIGGLEEAHVAARQQIESLQDVISDLRLENDDLRSKLELQTQRLELTMQQGGVTSLHHTPGISGTLYGTASAPQPVEDSLPDPSGEACAMPLPVSSMPALEHATPTRSYKSSTAPAGAASASTEALPNGGAAAYNGTSSAMGGLTPSSVGWTPGPQARQQSGWLGYFGFRSRQKKRIRSSLL